MKREGIQCANRPEYGKNVSFDAAPYSSWPDDRHYHPFVDATDADRALGPFHVNELPQIRTSYNPEKIFDLAERVRTENAEPPYIELQQAIRIAEFTNQADFETFLSDYQLYYNREDPLTAESFEAEPNGAIRILNFGHRRTRAIKVVADMSHYTVRDCDVKSETVYNPTFEQFINAQSKENEHDRPSPEDEAAEIRRRFNFYTVKNNGQSPTKKWLAAKMGYSEDKIRAGLRFTELSPAILSWFNDKLINYEIAVECWRLIDTAKQYYSQKYPGKYSVGTNELQKAAEDVTLATLSDFARNHMKGVSYDRKLAIVKAKINSLDLSQQQVALFDDSLWDNPNEQKQVSSKRMAHYAIGLLEHRLNDGGVTDEELVALDALTRQLQNAKEMRQAALAEKAEEAEFMAAQDLFA